MFRPRVLHDAQKRHNDCMYYADRTTLSADDWQRNIDTAVDQSKRLL